MNHDKRGHEEIVERTTNALLQGPIPDGPPPEVLEAVLTAGETPGEKPQTTKNRKRILTMNRFAKIAASIVIVVGVGAFVIVMLDRGTTVAFAEVQRQIREAQSMTYTMTMAGMKMPDGKEMTMTMEMAYKEPGLMRTVVFFKDKRQEGQGITIMDFEQGKGISLVPEQKIAIPIELGQLPEEARSEMTNYAAELKRMIEASDEPLGEKQIDGRDVKGWKVTDELGNSMDVWVDPETGHPLLVEGEISGMASYTMSDFVINPQLDDSLFDLTIPEGYEVGPPVDISMENLTEQDLIDGLRFFAELNNNTFPGEGMLTPEMMENLKKRGKRLGEDMKKRYEQEEPLSDTEKQKMMQEVMPEIMQEVMPEVKKFTRFIVFVQLNAKDTWCYVGEGVKLGDSETPICWYRPKDSETYRVVYGDLTVMDVAAEDLPEKPADTAPSD